VARADGRDDPLTAAEPRSVHGFEALARLEVLMLEALARLEVLMLEALARLEVFMASRRWHASKVFRPAHSRR
jgi:hypothetical protein